ncbi:Tat pathway signal sequence domain protein [Streptomyces fodineus]|uniref:Tat pathway signal sequence domain protein n=1 Tax=Streptomyces fodineus TaxID=1904616 RepID=UPI0009A1267F|nr:Tat pathway signal sequence domain protein [Streptomyces fodineus]
MSGIGPLEPGEGTRAWDARRPVGPTPRRAGRIRSAVAARYARHRRATLAFGTAAVLLAGGGYLYATRPQQPSPPPPPPAPYPAQVVEVAYVGGRATPAGAPPRSFSFAVLLSVESGPPVTVTRVSQPYAGLSLVTVPRTPFRAKAGSDRKITITMHVTQCGKVPMDAGMPFLDVTLRNARAMQIHSYILGTRYAQHLSQSLKVACSHSPLSSPKPSRRLN